MSLPREPVIGQPASTLWAQQLQRHVQGLARPGYTPRPKPIPRRAAATGARYHPFQLIDASDPDPKVMVTEGFLGTDLDAESSETLANLETALAIVADSLIYLHWKTAVGWTIRSESAASLTNWADYPDLIKHNTSSPYAQTDYWLLIGYVGATPTDIVNTPGFPVTISSDPYWVYQCLRTDLLETALCYNGQPALYPFAHPAPFR